RHPERLRLDVPERQLDAGDRLVRHAAEVLAGDAQHVPVEAPDGPRVLADQDLLVVARAAGDAKRVATVAALAPADQPIVCLDLHEGPRPPAGIAVEGLNPCDSHGPSPTRCSVKHARIPRGRAASTRPAPGGVSRAGWPALPRGSGRCC